MKKTGKRIVCATDFSENARRAAEVAVAIALRLRVILVLVHVTDQTNTFGESTKDFRDLMQRTRAELHAEATRLQRDGLVIEEVLLHGRWAEYAVEDLLKETPAELVVVSSVSKTTFDRWTLGSVSEHIAQNASVPTLVVRRPDRLLTWARQECSLHVLVAVDFTVCSDAALALVKELRRIGPCAVTAAHINWPPEEHRWSPESTWALTSNPPRIRRRLLRDLERKVAEFIPEPVRLRIEPNWGRPDAPLVDLAERASVDLIVVGLHQRHGIKRAAYGSVSRGVLRHAPMSVIGVPVPPALAHGVQRQPRVERVLVATDLTPAGDQAIPWAYAAVAPGGIVKLVHVMPPWEPASPLVPRYERRPKTRGAHHQHVAQSREKLAALVPAGVIAAGIRTEIEIVGDRDVAHGIGVSVRQFGADLICLSSGKWSGLAERILGSVVREVAAQNGQPVLLVRPEEP